MIHRGRRKLQGWYWQSRSIRQHSQQAREKNIAKTKSIRAATKRAEAYWAPCYASMSYVCMYTPHDSHHKMEPKWRTSGSGESSLFSEVKDPSLTFGTLFLRDIFSLERIVSWVCIETDIAVAIFCMWMRKFTIYASNHSLTHLYQVKQTDATSPPRWSRIVRAFVTVLMLGLISWRDHYNTNTLYLIYVPHQEQCKRWPPHAYMYTKFGAIRWEVSNQF